MSTTDAINDEPMLRAVGPDDAAAIEALREGYTAYRDEWLYRGTAAAWIASRRSRAEDVTLCVVYRAAVAGLVMATVSDGAASIDYMLGSRYRGRGLATRAVAALLARLFGRGLDPVRIAVDVANRESAAIPERLGLRVERTEADAIDYGDGAPGTLRVYRLDRPADSGRA